MSKQKKSELLFILICTVIALIAVFFLSGCSHVKELEYYETGQIKKDTERTGVLFSENKQFSIIEIN